MSFLAPLLLLGAAGIAAPIWLHLRRRYEERTVAFSTLRFFDPEDSPTLGSLRLQDLFLLALRALALLLIVTAFAGPYLRGRAAVSGSRVHLLDATFSRRADGAAFAADVAEIRRAIESSPVSMQEAVVVLGADAEVAVSFRDDRDAALAALAAVEPSYSRGSYLSAFRAAQSELERSLGAERQLVVYADHQENQWTEALDAAPFLDGVEVEWARLPDAASRPNLSIGEPAVKRWFVGDEAALTLSAEIVRRGEAPGAELELIVGGESILQRSLRFTGPEDRLLLHAEWSDENDGWIDGEVRLRAEADALAPDDVAYFSFPPPRPEPVILFARSPFLEAALSPAVARERWRGRWPSPSDIDPELEPLARVLVVEASFLQSDRVRRLFERHLEAGRGVVLFIDRLVPGARDALAAHDVRLVTPGEDAAETEPVGFVTLFHPLFRPFRGGDLGRLAEVRALATAGFAADAGGQLLFSRTGVPLLVERSAPGRLLVFPFAMNRAQTNWPVLPSFIPFVDQLLQYAGAIEGGRSEYRPGEVLSLPLDDVDERAFELVGPAGELVSIARPAAPRLDLRLPEGPGIYELRGAAGELVSKAAVNPPPRESALDYVLEPSVAAWSVPADASSAGDRTPAEAGVDRSAARQGAAPLRLGLAAAGFLLLLAEQAYVSLRGRGKVA